MSEILLNNSSRLKQLKQSRTYVRYVTPIERFCGVGIMAGYWGKIYPCIFLEGNKGAIIICEKEDVQEITEKEYFVEKLKNG